MERQTLIFAMERETKNTVRYQEEAAGKSPVVGTLYVQRWALGEPAPQRLTRTDCACREDSSSVLIQSTMNLCHDWFIEGVA